MKITCNVIEDLMVQYVDGTLSEDSRLLVEEHLDSCGECRKKVQQIRTICEELDGGDRKDAKAKTEREYGTFRRFRRWMNVRRAVTVIISALITFCLVGGGMFLAFNYESYMPYGKTGMYVTSDGMMFMKEPFYGYRGVYSGFDSSGDMVEIFYMTDTFEKRHLGKATRSHVVDFGVEDRGVWTDDNGVEEKIPAIDKVYYLNEEYVDEYNLTGLFNSHATLLPLDTSEEEDMRLIDEVEKSSILVWERND